MQQSLLIDGDRDVMKRDMIPRSESMKKSYYNRTAMTIRMSHGYM